MSEFGGGVSSSGGGIGGIIENAFERGRQDYWAEQTQQWNEEKEKRDYARAKEFAQMGIQWKVADAQAAGVHPLYAVGASGPGFSSSGAVGVGDVGSVQSHSSQLYETGEERQLRFEQMNAIKAGAAKDEAQKAYYEALTAVEKQKLNPGPRTLLGDPSGGQGQGVTIPDWDISAPGNVGVVQLQGDPTYSARQGNPQLGAAPNKPFWSEYALTDDLRIQLPWTQEGPGEALENVSWWMWPSIVMMNKQYYGEDWLGRLFSALIGGKTEFRHAPESLKNFWKDQNSGFYEKSGRERGVNWRRPNRETSYRWNVK